MYDSPIEVIYQDIQYSLENKILKACQDVNVNVNKEELIKALQYDRNQYQKGYYDGLNERKKGKWIQNNNGTYSCNLCHSWIPEEQYYYAQFCLYCGADMRGEKDEQIRQGVSYRSSCYRKYSLV